MLEYHETFSSLAHHGSDAQDLGSPADSDAAALPAPEIAAADVSKSPG